MKHRRIVFLILAIVLLAASAWAETPSTPQTPVPPTVKVPTPPKITTPAPPNANMPTQAPAQQAKPPATSSTGVVSGSIGSGTTTAVPAGIGKGPLPALNSAPASTFDRTYIEQMYQLHNNISALATQGIEQSTDKDLKDLSGKIRYEQTKQNEKLASWHMQMGYGRIPVDYNRIGSVVNTLSNYNSANFNAGYAQAMIDLLQQARQSAQLAMTKASMPELRDQAKIVADSSASEINALQRWLNVKAQ